MSCFSLPPCNLRFINSAFFFSDFFFILRETHFDEQGLESNEGQAIAEKKA